MIETIGIQVIPEGLGIQRIGGDHHGIVALTALHAAGIVGIAAGMVIAVVIVGQKVGIVIARGGMDPATGSGGPVMKDIVLDGNQMAATAVDIDPVVVFFDGVVADGNDTIGIGGGTGQFNTRIALV